jgi:hypothetical protein
LRHVLGWGGGMYNVHVNLRHMHMLHLVFGGEWCGVCLRFMLYKLRHMHMLRHVLGWGGGVC